MPEKPKIEPIPPGDWWPPDYEKRGGDLLMTMPCAVKSLSRIGERLFAELENGQTIDLTELLGEPKH